MLYFKHKNYNWIDMKIIKQTMAKTMKVVWNMDRVNGVLIDFQSSYTWLYEESMNEKLKFCVNENA